MGEPCPDCGREQVVAFADAHRHAWRWRCETCEPFHPVELPTIRRPNRAGRVPADDTSPLWDDVIRVIEAR